MKKLRKILLWTAGGIVVLLLLVVLGFRLFFPMEKAKDYALREASRALGREVAIETVELSLRGGLGLRLQDVRVGNPAGFPGEPFLTTDNVDLKVALLPLLRGEVRADRLVINGPVIRAHKLADGSDNFTFAPAAAGDTASGAGAAEEPAPVNASIDRIEINGGSVDFRDEAAGAGVRIIGLELRSRLGNPAGRILLAEGSISADSLLVMGEQPLPPLSPRAEFAVRYDQDERAGAIEKLTLDIASISLNATGEFSGSGDDFVAAAKVTADRVTIGQLLALAPPEALEPMKDLTVNGAVSLTCDVDFASALETPLDYTGKLTVHELTAKAKDVSAELTIHSAEATFEPDHLVFVLTDAEAAGEKLTGRVEVRDFLAPRVDGQLAGAADLALAEPFLEPDLKAKLAGKAAFSVQFSGPVDVPDSLDVTGRLDLHDVRLTAAPLPEPVQQLDGRIDFRRDRVTVTDLHAETPSSSFTLSGSLSDPLPYFLPPEQRKPGAPVPQPQVQFELRSRRLDVDRLFPPASPAAEAGSGGTAAPPAAPIEFPDIAGRGTVKIDTLIYSGVELTDITTQVEIADRKIRCLDADGSVYSGRIAGETTIDLSDADKPGYSGSFAATQVEVDDFLRRFSKFGGLFYGKLDLEGDFSAAGLAPDAIRHSLTFDSLAAMKNGRVTTSGFASSALANLAAKSGRDVEKEQALKNLSTKIHAENGRVILDHLTAGLGAIGDLTLGGSYGFDGGLDFSGSLLLSKTQTKQLLEAGGLTGKLAGLLGADQADRLALPLSLGGSLTGPKLSVDYASLTSAAAAKAKEDLKENAKKDLGNKLKGLLK